MDDDLFDPVLDRRVTMPATPVEIVAATESAPARAADDGPAVALRRGVDDRLDGRVPCTVARGTWRVLAASPLSADFDPSVLLVCDDRVVLAGGGAWELRGRDLAPIARGAGEGDVVLDPARRVFYRADRVGRIGALSLDAGAPAFDLQLTFGQEYERRLVARRGSELVVASARRALDQHAPPQPDMWTLETVGVTTDGTERLGASGATAVVARRSARLAAALHGANVVVATEDRIYTFGPALEVVSVLRGEFAPVAMSLDEAGRAHLIVETGGAVRFWIVTPGGRRVADVPLPDAFARAGTPPIIGYDHAVWIVSGERVVGISGDGVVRYERSAGARIVGAVVTRDGRLVFGAGSAVSVLDAAGGVGVLHDFAGEHVRTAPVPTGPAEILVATDRSVYRLAPGE